MKINPIKFLNIKTTKNFYTHLIEENPDTVNFSGNNIDKSILVSKKIMGENTDLNTFFENITLRIFKNQNPDFLSGLLNGEISLSTSAYNNPDYPYSAVGIVLDTTKSDAYHLNQLNEHIINGLGIGINFSQF